MRLFLILSFVISTIVNLSAHGIQNHTSHLLPIDQNTFEESVLFSSLISYETSIICISFASEIELEDDESSDYIRFYNSHIFKNKDFKKYLTIDQKEQIISSYLSCFVLDLPPPEFFLK